MTEALRLKERHTLLCYSIFTMNFEKLRLLFHFKRHSHLMVLIQVGRNSYLNFRGTKFSIQRIKKNKIDCSVWNLSVEFLEVA